MNPENNDIISLSDLLVTLIKHIKLWLALLIIGALGSVFYGIQHQDSYQFSVYLQGPTYIDNGITQELLPKAEFGQLLDIYYQQAQDAFDVEKEPLIRYLAYDKTGLTLSIKAFTSEQEQVKSLLTSMINYIEKQPQYQENLTNWQNNIEFNLQQLQAQNKIYAETVRQFQHNVDSLSKLKDISNVNGQSLLNNLSNTILSYQNQMYNNNVQIQHYQSRMQTLNKQITMRGGLVKSNKPVGLTSPIIILFGMILSLILATVVVFLVEFFRNLSVEIKQKLSR